MKAQKKVRISLDLMPNMKSTLEKLAEQEGSSQGEILRRSIVLFKLVKEGERKGRRMALTKNGKILYKLVGF